MKKLTLIFTLLFSTVVFSPPIHADGKRSQPCGLSQERNEAYNFGLKIKNLLIRKDINALSELISSEHPYQKKKLIGKKLSDFDQKSIDEILNSNPSCYPFYPGKPIFSIAGYIHYQNEWYLKSSQGLKIIGFHIPLVASKISKFPEGWKYNNKTLHPLCFKTDWKNGARSMTLENCLRIKKGSLKVNKSSGTISSNDTGKDVDFYTVLEQLKVGECQKLSKAGKFLECYILKTGQSGYGSSSLILIVTYGLIQMPDGTKNIIPLKFV